MLTTNPNNFFKTERYSDDSVLSIINLKVDICETHLIVSKPILLMARTECWSQTVERVMSETMSLEAAAAPSSCSRSEFQAQRAKLEALLREASRATIQGDIETAGERQRAEMTLESEVEQRLQRLILRAKGMVSEEMLVRHQREIPVDEIPDYAVTHLLVELGEKELQRHASVAP